jgi:hypothetical protein
VWSAGWVAGGLGDGGAPDSAHGDGDARGGHEIPARRYPIVDMKLPLALLALLGAGCATSAQEGPGERGYVEVEASAEAWKAPEAPPPGAPSGASPDAAAPIADATEPRAPAPDRAPPTPPPHVDELFRTPGGAVGAPDPAPAPPPAQPFPAQTTKPAPPPKPPPRPRPNPWGNDPCPPCGMG